MLALLQLHLLILSLSFLASQGTGGTVQPRHFTERQTEAQRGKGAPSRSPSDSLAQLGREPGVPDSGPESEPRQLLAPWERRWGLSLLGREPPRPWAGLGTHPAEGCPPGRAGPGCRASWHRRGQHLVNAGRSPCRGKGEPRGKQAGSNGNQSEGQRQQDPRPAVSMGTEPGGGVLAGLPQQMWPVQGWRGAAGGAAPGGRALGRGRPGPDSRTSPGPRVCHLQEATQIPPTPGHSHWPLQPKFLLPWLRPAPSCTISALASRRAPVFAGTWETQELGTDPSVVALALQPVSRRSTRPAPPGPWTVLPVPFLRPKLAPPTALRGALENQVGAEPPQDTRKPQGHWQSTGEAATRMGTEQQVSDAGRSPCSLAESWFP